MSTFNFDNALTVDQTFRDIYLQFPKVFLTGEKYKNLSDSAKIAYMVLKDRAELSVQNNWVDEHNRIYFIFTKQELADVLNKSKTTAIKIAKELEENGLIYQKDMGFNKEKMKRRPNHIYISNLSLSASDVYDIKKYNEKVRNIDTAHGTTSVPSQNETGSGDNVDTAHGTTSVPSQNSHGTTSVPELYNTPYKDFKEFKDNKERYEYQNNQIENSFISNKGDYDSEKQLIDQFIEDNSIEKNYGKWIVTNFKKYSYGDFDTFQIYYEKLYYAHKGAEEELGMQFMLDPYFTDRADTFKFELSKTFWRVIQTSRSGKVKKDVNNLLFASFRNDFISFGKSIKYAQENKGKPNVPLINPFEEGDKN